MERVIFDSDLYIDWIEAGLRMDSISGGVIAW